MALRIDQLISAARHSVMQAAGKPYVLGMPHEAPNFPGYVAFLTDPDTGCRVTMTWTRSDDILCSTENRKIALVQEMLKNAIQALDMQIEQDVGADPGEDVVNDMVTGMER